MPKRSDGGLCVVDEGPFRSYHMAMEGLRQVFVCATPGEGRCGAKGGDELLEGFRAEVERRGLSPFVVVRNACTRRHHEGPVVFVYPDDVWYTRVTLEDVPQIVERHLVPARVES